MLQLPARDQTANNRQRNEVRSTEDLSRFLSCGGRGSLGENLAIIFREILGRFRFLQLTGDFYKNEGDEGSLETFAEFEERLYDDFIKKINLNVITKRRRSLTL